MPFDDQKWFPLILGITDITHSIGFSIAVAYLQLTIFPSRYIRNSRV